jgi:branched-chain amino acid transport system substrate-binding protein
MYGVYWSGTEPDVKDVGTGAKGYNALNIQNAHGKSKASEDIIKYVHEKGMGTGPKEEVGSILYNQGMLVAMVTVEAVRRAQERFGKGQPMTGEQVRWGAENLQLDPKRLESVGVANLLPPLMTSCNDHMGTATARVQTWNGSKWEFSSEPIAADMNLLRPLIKAAADQYLAEKKVSRRNPADCQS